MSDNSIRRIAVVGSGISGLASAWLLSSKYEVDLYESGNYLGGHTNTVDINVEGVSVTVDTGFMVCNYRTYPNFTQMLSHIGVELHPSNMSFSVQVKNEGIEWAGNNLNTVFAQRRNIFRLGFLRMLYDIQRLSRTAPRLLSDGSLSALSLRDFLSREGYSREFCDWYLVPMGSAIWSVPPVRMLDFPVAAFLRFCDNHGLLKLRDKAQWYSVVGGARNYVKRLASEISGKTYINSRVTEVRRFDDHVEINLENEADARTYDGVVLATHADDTLHLLQDPSETETKVLESFTYQKNSIWLHSDTNFLPTSDRAIASWNYLSNTSDKGTKLSVTYNLNLLQGLSSPKTVMVTLNPSNDPNSDLTYQRITFSHPVFTSESVSAQDQIKDIQGVRRTWFVGAWQRYGFHEDGLVSAISVAADHGIKVPWERSSSDSL